MGNTVFGCLSQQVEPVGQCMLHYAEDVPGTLPELLSLEVSSGYMPT